MIIVMSDGTIKKIKDDVRIESLPQEVVAIVKNPQHKPNSDAAFIHMLSKRNGRKMGADNSVLDKDEFIDKVIVNHSTRVALVKINDVFEYVAFSYLDSFENGLVASIHGMVRDCDLMGNKTIKYIKQFKKHKIFDIMIDDYFKSYNNHPDLNIDSIEAYLPDFLKEKIVYSKDTNHDRIRKSLPTAKLLDKTGFKPINPQYPKRNSCWKNGKARDVFIYQLHQKWWNRNKFIKY